ncbi:uncharacterized protein LOC121380431 [Gigantopelta aegis]|uniref:uncharacterized protein LOC121380431 n=1 Tax=Gigantopelta aegis TaxID=1735272 RepID=UPI001B8890ED|nr:uncharacterized protein LOC121380431 [Gigantopelta aegis]
MGCVTRCAYGRCLAASFHAGRKICQLHRKPISSQEVTFHESPEWEYAQLITDVVLYDDWILAFRATAHINQSAYTTWITPGHYDDHPAIRHDVPIGCSSVNSSHFCDRHFRSKLIDKWNSFNIDQVKVVLYKNGVAVANLTFSGTGTSSTSWFSQTKLISSSWNDMSTSTFNYFSMEGDARLVRYWFISNVYGGCPHDVGWMVVLEKPTAPCDWEKAVTAGYPAFLYAPTNQKVVWDSNNVEEADVMAVFLKILP